jgi:hypothetical protein
MLVALIYKNFSKAIQRIKITLSGKISLQNDLKNAKWVILSRRNYQLAGNLNKQQWVGQQITITAHL